MKSIFSYHKEAYALAFSRIIPTYFIFVFILLMTLFAFSMPVLLPLVSMLSVLYLMRFKKAKRSDLKETVEGLDITINQYLILLITVFVKRVIITTGYVLFIVPGIIFSYALAPIAFLFANNQNYKSSEVIKTSIDGMKGYKFKLFLLTLLGRLPLIIWLLIVVAFMANNVPQIGVPLLLLFFIALHLLLIRKTD